MSENADEKPQSDRALYRNPNLLVIYAVSPMSVLGVASLTPAFPAITDCRR